MSTKDCKHSPSTTSKKGGKGKRSKSSNPVQEGKTFAAIRKIHQALTDCHLRCKARAAANVAPSQPAGWFGGTPDLKTPIVSDPYAEFKALAATSRAAVQSMLGMKAIRFRLPVTNSMSCAVTTGLVSATLALDISLSPEFASLAALFDEYRFEGGRFDFNIICPTPTIVLGTSAITGASLAAIGYDPADATAATNVRDILQLEQHVQHFARIVPTATAGTFVGVYGTQDNGPLRLSWKCARLATVSGNGGAVAPGMWKSTQGNVSNFPDGTIKPFYLSGETTAKACFEGTMYWDVHFRSRT